MKLGFILYFMHAHRGAKVRRLYKERNPHLTHDPFIGNIVPIFFMKNDELRGGYPGVAQKPFLHILVHAYRRTKHAGPDGRNVNVLSIPCTVPSSPNVPWSTGNTTLTAPTTLRFAARIISPFSPAGTRTMLFPCLFNFIDLESPAFKRS